MSLHARPVRTLASVLVFALGWWVSGAGATDLRFRYVSLDAAALPQGVLFFDAQVLDDAGRVYGTAYRCTTPDCNSVLPHVAIYRNGAVRIRVQRASLATAANERGTIGGSLLTDPDNFLEQATLFHGDRRERVPRLPGEVSSSVHALSDSGSAIVLSFDAGFALTPVLYRNGESTVLDLGPGIASPFGFSISSKGVIAGTQGTSFCDDVTGFRFNPRNGDLDVLAPQPTEPAAVALDINSRGQVLGYSFVCGGLERIGIWRVDGVFRTWFVEGTDEFPTISNALLFNDDNLIVITDVSSPDAEASKVSYVLPRPGVRLNLADLVTNLPPDVNLSVIKDINERGDMIGFDRFSGGSFLLKRLGVPSED